MLVGLPSGLLQIIFIWVTVLGIRATKIPRCYWGVAVTLLPLMGNIGIFCIPDSSKWGVVVFTWFSTLISPVMVITLSLMASNTKGNTKRSAASNAYFISYGLAAIIAPQLWQTSDSPRYTKGITADIICFVLIIVAFIGYRFLVLWENKRKDRAQEAAPQVSSTDNIDVTDREDLEFRYVS
jgi:ACS family allantoate permease-like MFS transporter